jgi:potassium-transporting ATPase KdpC subunit
MKTFRISLRIFLIMTVLTGLIYPLLITGIAQSFFSSKANGSLILKSDTVIGSRLIGQSFNRNIYFSSRPSVNQYNPLPSGGSNLGLTNVKLTKLVDERKKEFLKYNALNHRTEIPSEMLFASASGLDPHISVEAAMLQVERIAANRRLDILTLQKMVKRFAEPRQLGFLGETRVNVLILNIQLDELQK